MKPLSPAEFELAMDITRKISMVHIPELHSAVQMMVHNEQALAQLRALSCADDATILRNVGMPQPTAAFDELLSMLLTHRLSDFVEALHEYGRRVDYCKRRYAASGRFEIESEEQ